MNLILNQCGMCRKNYEGGIQWMISIEMPIVMDTALLQNQIAHNRLEISFDGVRSVLTVNETKYGVSGAFHKMIRK